MPKKRTHAEFVELLSGISPDISVIGIYVNSTTKIEVTNNICKHSWLSKPMSLLNGTNCPICNGSQKKTQEQFENELSKVNSNIKIIGHYDGLNKKVSCKCLKDNYKWEVLPSNLLRGHGCPVCNGKVVVKGINDVATTNPEILKYIKNINDAYKYSNGSHSYIDFICPDCGNIRNLQIKSVINQGFSCTVCSDGISYPNKFARNLLKQLNVDNLQHEYQPKWSGKYRYDNYFEFKGKKYILEMDGEFHFKDNTLSNQSVEISKNIDEIKDSLASANGIEIIRIDCRKSTESYIKESIEKSKLNKLFDLDCIDWAMCNMFAASNFTKEVCQYYQDNKIIMSKKDVGKYFSISDPTLYKYLKIGATVGWIKNDVEETILNSLHSNSPNSRKIIVSDIQSGEILYEFKSINLCRKVLQDISGDLYNSSAISYAIKNKNGLYKNYIFKYA